MKVWRVQMNLDIYTDAEEKVFFDCEEEKGDFYMCNDDYVENTKGWIATRIPRDINVYKSYSVIVAKMGIDHQPSKDELQELKQRLKESIEEFVDDDLNQYLENYKIRIKELNKIN